MNVEREREREREIERERERERQRDRDRERTLQNKSILVEIVRYIFELNVSKLFV
jgi:hypothetical protein